MYCVKDKVAAFFDKYSMGCNGISVEQSCRMFAEEMKNSLNGKESTLEMIPTYIEIGKKIPVNKPVIVIDAGGTSLRRAVVRFNSQCEPVIDNYEKYPMPGTNGEITSDDFFKIIASYLQPVINASDTIAFCFSFTTETLPDKDAKVTMLGKQIKIKNLVGEILGKRLIKEIGIDKRVIVLNDSVASLLGGAGYPQKGKSFDDYIGFILGTGTNTCYIEQCKNIGKLLPAEKEGSMIINTESGGYGKFPRGNIDREFDLGTIDPGVYLFEKVIGGKYEGNLILLLIGKAVEDGLFSDYFGHCLKCIDTLPSASVDSFIASPFGENVLAKCCQGSNAGDDDRATLYYLIDFTYERSAMLIFINLASIMMKTGKGKNPCSPVCVVVEGSTINNSELLMQKINYYIKRYLNDRFNIYCKFIKVDNANLIGTAIAGLTN